MRLICYPTSGQPPKIIPAPVDRAWMDATPDGFAYRCLPLNIANAHGWLILNDAPFTATWDGGGGTDAITLARHGTEGEMLGLSHFGSGVLTFRVRGLFRTEPGYDLWVAGPVNAMKDAIQPLGAVVETDWSPFTFTMNWRFTRSGTLVSFAQDEPICMIFPVPRGLIEAVQPEFRALDEDPEVRAAYLAWAESRRNFNENLKIPGSAAQNQKWQKEYFRGKASFGTAPPDHRTKAKPRPFK